MDALHQWEECGTPAEGGERLSAECRRRTVADACQWMERHLPERFSAAELSCAVHVSVRSLQYGSQEELGCTPMAHAKRLRLRRLRRSLQDQHHRGVDGCINM